MSKWRTHESYAQKRQTGAKIGQALNNYNQRYSKPWSGGYRRQERNEEDKFDKIYSLLSEQVEERELRKREAAKQELLEEEKMKLRAEEEKRLATLKEQEEQEARLGRIVRTSVKAVCESALGRKVEIPDDDASTISKLQKELNELREKTAAGSGDSRIEALRKEKEALMKIRNQESEEDRLQQEIAELKDQKGKDKADVSKQDEIAALHLQIKELSSFCAVLEEKSAEVSTLKTENGHLRKDLHQLRDEFECMREKRGSGEVTLKSPPEEPAKGKQRVDPSTTAMYTPRDMEALQKAYKDALRHKEMAAKEVDFMQDRMARMGATSVRIRARKASARKTTPRDLKGSFETVEVESDGEGAGRGNGEGTARKETNAAQDRQVEKMAKFRDIHLKELRQAKKADMEKACEDEGISYIKLEQAKADVAEIRASRDFDAWLKEADQAVEDQDYATSTEDVPDE
ncbi:hypothetical protein CBR_g751 [Chara braunii]|uniref:Uncharacterized protein n=1 Tax=Chara braunii TaxID=69332 RepID=A0A388KC65_CHABU|nr:hypothetical protein CBR_g751 [Chara braunii]|eukprot:GBG67621.1 hypothetical protein CBR_g751 [Chara braunii]